MVVNQESIDRAKPFMTKAITENNATNLGRIFEAAYPVNEPIAETGRVTPLMYCCALGGTECINRILQEGPDFTLRDAVGRTCLHYVCKGGSKDNFETLLAAMPRETLQLLKESRTVGGVTPLMCAVQSGNIYLVGACLNKGLNPYCKDDLGQTPDIYARNYGGTEEQSME